MPHRNTHRRTIPAPNPNQSPDPNLIPHPTSKPDPTTISSELMPKFYTKHAFPASKQPINPYPHHKDANFQAKYMTASALDHSSKFSHPRTDTLNGRRRTKEENSSNNNQKCKNYSKEFSNKKKFSEVNEKRESLEGFDRNRSSSLCVVVKDEELKVVEEGKKLGSLCLGDGKILGRRRSFGGSQVELKDVFANNGVKVVSADMPPFMQIHAVNFARKTHDSMEKFTSKSLALTLKKEFDGVYGPAWHCIVGKNFGSFVTHSVGGFLYFSMDQKLYILLFKTAVQRAD